MVSSGQPRVSIGMPVYNGGSFIAQAIDSILDQSFTNFELIISDNASTDNTEGLCRQFAARDHRVRYYRNTENMGAAWNYNRVFELAVGEYFKWAAADDLCGPGFFSHCVEQLDRDSGVVLSYPRTTVIDEDGNFVEHYIDGLELDSDKPHERYQRFHARFRYHEKSNPIFGLIRTDVLKQTQLIGKYTGSDVVLLGELAILGKISEIPEHLFFRRDHPQASVRAFKLQQRATWFDPSQRGTYQYAKWRLFSEHIKSVRRFRLGLSERYSCYWQLGRWFLWNFEGLRKESLVFVLRLPYRLPRPIFGALRFLWKSAKSTVRTLGLSRSRSVKNKP